MREDGDHFEIWDERVCNLTIPKSEVIDRWQQEQEYDPREDQ